MTRRLKRLCLPAAMLWLSLGGAFAQTNIVRFDLGDFTLLSLTNRKVTIMPLDAPWNAGGKIIARDKRTYTASNGVFFVTNMVAGDYQGEILAPPASTPFYFTVTNSATVMDAGEQRIPTDQAGVIALGYTRAQVDALLAAQSNSLWNLMASMSFTNAPSAPAILVGLLSESGAQLVSENGSSLIPE